MARKRKLKKWNGRLILKHGQLPVCIAAYSQKDAVALLEEHGCRTSLYEFRGWWSDCWGNSMDGIEADKRGLWVQYKRGEAPKFIELGAEIH